MSEVYNAPLASPGSLQLSDTSYILPNPLSPPSLLHGSETRPRPLSKSCNFPDVPKDEACQKVDPQDVGTPDQWIPRDSRLVRLTGKHPFNAEAKLNDLFFQGFFTPSNLFFVRNHGAVPQVDSKMAHEWKVQLHGLCDNPVSLSLEDLSTKFKVITVPVTLVCAGNRRKEQNVVQKSLGFSWGAGGISTALFTGVWLADVIELIRPKRSAKHVIFEGGDSLPNGPYGTSQLLSWARDPRRGMLLAWAMNGLPLEPDHGFPLRLVVPGQIGGRSVKWLKRIEFSQKESQHHLHFHDNKVLPMPIGPDQARAEKSWWYDPRYIIRDLNVNSAIACPNHDEVLDLNDMDHPTYTLRGYAYSGGGRRVTRVEITLDDGASWELANIHYIEDQFREAAQVDTVYGTLDLTDSDQCFCWCFWTFDVPLASLQNASSIAVRAMDESLGLQPRNMYWNATGMMNNWWFRICIHKVDGEKLRFEHPTMAGTQSGGWMQRLKDQGLDPTNPLFSDATPKPTGLVAPPQTIVMTKPDINRKISMEELAAHSTAENPWFVLHGEVYDATQYLNDHPGGAQSITLVAGEDASEDFMAIHSSDAKKKLVEYHIGTLIPGEATQNLVEVDDDGKQFLHPKKWKSVELIQITDVSKDSKIFRFVLDRPDQQLGLPIGQHVYVRLKRKAGLTSVEGEIVQRAYTPLSRQDDQGFIDMLVKIYYPNAQYPSGGKMTVGFAELALGNVVELKGPIGHFVWEGNGTARIHGKQRRICELGMVCGGSGITPILQVLRGIFQDPADESTTVKVLNINRHIDDILCRAELDELVEKYPSRLRVRYSLTGSPIPGGWTHSVGRVDSKMIEEYLPAPHPDRIVCVCGPPLMEQLVRDTLHKLAWEVASQVVIF